MEMRNSIIVYNIQYISLTLCCTTLSPYCNISFLCGIGLHLMIKLILTSTQEYAILEDKFSSFKLPIICIGVYKAQLEYLYYHYHQYSP